MGKQRRMAKIRSSAVWGGNWGKTGEGPRPGGRSGRLSKRKKRKKEDSERRGIEKEIRDS